MTYGERSTEPIQVALRRLLDDRNLTDTELMARADVSPATVSQYLSGRRGTRMNSQALRTVEKFAAALDVSPTYFLEYREALAEKLVREAMRAGLVSLEALEMLVEGARVRRATGENPEE